MSLPFRPAPVVALGLVLASPLAAQQEPAAPDTTQKTGASVTVKFGGYIQARETYQSGTGLTATLNRVRVNMDGTIAGGFTFRVQPEYEAGATATTPATVSLRDAYLRWTRSEFTLTAGQFKTPFTREFTTSIALIETADRSTVVDSLAPKRDIGLMAEYAWKTSGSLAVGVFNGEGQNRVSNKDTTVMVVARLTARPVPQLSLAGNLAYYRSDSTRYGVDGSFEFRGFTAKGEYLWEHRKALGPPDNGWYALVAYRVVPWIQLVAKQEDFRRSAVSAAQRNQATTAGINLEFAGGKVRLTSDYVSRKIGTPGTRHGMLISQLQYRF
jgi:hypothetical protein